MGNPMGPILWAQSYEQAIEHSQEDLGPNPIGPCGAGTSSLAVQDPLQQCESQATVVCCQATATNCVGTACASLALGVSANSEKLWLWHCAGTCGLTVTKSAARHIHASDTGAPPALGPVAVGAGSQCRTNNSEGSRW